MLMKKILDCQKYIFTGQLTNNCFIYSPNTIISNKWCVHFGCYLTAEGK